MKITPEEEANGWTQEALDRYRRERNRAQANLIFKPKNTKPKEQNHNYRPHKWRKK